ncbi:unnamed protein product [Malus baccata var. baccata]
MERPIRGRSCWWQRNINVAANSAVKAFEHPFLLSPRHLQARQNSTISYSKEISRKKRRAAFLYN